MQEYNPRFVAYATVHGRDPEAQLEHDRAAWPGGCMCGFILWIRDRLVQFGRLHPNRGYFIKARLTDEGQSAYTEWLATLNPENMECPPPLNAR